MQSPPKIAYGAINQAVLARVPPTCKRLLDVGCGTGALGHAIKQATACEIVGLTYSEEEAASARTRLETVFVCDLNTCDFEDMGMFDCIVCSHVLEHLYQPERVLKKLRPLLTPRGVLIVALPNIVHWRQRLQFLRGRFRYTDGGLMDSTHFRFFDRETALELVQGAGFEIVERVADGYFPLPGLRTLFRSLAPKLDAAATRVRPGLFGWQFILVARSASTM